LGLWQVIGWPSGLETIYDYKGGLFAFGAFSFILWFFTREFHF